MGEEKENNFDSCWVFKWELNLMRLASKGRSRWKADENFRCEAKQNNIDYQHAREQWASNEKHIKHNSNNRNENINNINNNNRVASRQAKASRADK